MPFSRACSPHPADATCRQTALRPLDLLEGRLASGTERLASSGGTPGAIRTLLGLRFSWAPKPSPRDERGLEGGPPPCLPSSPSLLAAPGELRLRSSPFHSAQPCRPQASDRWGFSGVGLCSDESRSQSHCLPVPPAPPSSDNRNATVTASAKPATSNSKSCLNKITGCP